MQPLPVPDKPANERRDSLPHQIAALWRDAPAWRVLATSTVILALVAASTPFLEDQRDNTPSPRIAAAPALTTAPLASVQPTPAVAPQQSAPACTLSAFPGTSGEGVVLGFLSPERAAALLAQTEAQLGAKINPTFTANRRAVVGIRGLEGSRRVVALVPTGAAIKQGDHVAFTGGHRDATLPCNYVPNLISGPAPISGNTR